jgi:hypothetical protein
MNTDEFGFPFPLPALTKSACGLFYAYVWNIRPSGPAAWRRGGETKGDEKEKRIPLPIHLEYSGGFLPPGRPAAAGRQRRPQDAKSAKKCLRIFRGGLCALAVKGFDLNAGTTKISFPIYLYACNITKEAFECRF